MTYAPFNTNFSWLPNEFDIPTDPQNQRKFINERERLTASIVNTKSNGNHQKVELLNGDQWFTTVLNGAEIPKYGFRYTFDLVELNGGVLAPGVTNIALSALANPIVINGIINPLPSYGSGTIAGPIYVFTGTDFNVTFDNTVPTAQVITVTNNTGTNLTQAYWEFNYLKQN